jgi:hypothetical protein
MDEQPAVTRSGGLSRAIRARIVLNSPLSETCCLMFH